MINNKDCIPIIINQLLGLNLWRQEWQVISMQVPAAAAAAVARSFILSARSTSSRALCHTCLARANSDWAVSISLLVISLTLSAYAFSTAAILICSAASHLSAATPLFPRCLRLSLSATSSSSSSSSSATIRLLLLLLTLIESWRSTTPRFGDRRLWWLYRMIDGGGGGGSDGTGRTG